MVCFEMLLQATNSPYSVIGTESETEKEPVGCELWFCSLPFSKHLLGLHVYVCLCQNSNAKIDRGTPIMSTAIIVTITPITTSLHFTQGERHKNRVMFLGGSGTSPRDCERFSGEGM